MGNEVHTISLGNREGIAMSQAYIKNQEMADQQLDQLQLKLGSP
jgi:hypothetical protein